MKRLSFVAFAAALLSSGCLDLPSLPERASNDLAVADSGYRDAAPSDAGYDLSGVDMACLMMADEPGDGVDSNCDRVDGVVEESIFVDPVDGNDDNDGTNPNRAVRTVGRGIQLAGVNERTVVLVNRGPHEGGISLGAGPAQAPLTVIGGYQEWLSLADGDTTAIEPTGDTAALHIAGRLNFNIAFHNFRFEAPTVPNGDALTTVVVIDAGSNEVRFEDCEIVGGGGSMGQPGAEGQAAGGAAPDGASYDPKFPRNGPAGGQNLCDAANASGFRGGNGGHCTGPIEPEDGLGPAGGTAGENRCTGTGTGSETGGAGVNGGLGESGAPTSGPPSLVDGTWTMPTAMGDGDSGAPGTGGSGGGGSGASGGNTGGGGGGGGAGGCGGDYGRAGGLGLSSIAMAVLNSNVVANGGLISVGSGGGGGDGGDGVCGQGGGAGMGGSFTRMAGLGGDGGDGGAAGAGAGGDGGWAIGVLHTEGAEVGINTEITTNTSAAGMGGDGGDTPTTCPPVDGSGASGQAGLMKLWQPVTTAGLLL